MVESNNVVVDIVLQSSICSTGNIMTIISVDNLFRSGRTSNDDSIDFFSILVLIQDTLPRKCLDT